MMKFLAMHAISLCWEYGTMNLSFWEMTEIIIKCGRRELEVRTFMDTIEIMCGECDGSNGLVRDPSHVCVE
jgi:hypothetical protein